MADYSGTNTGVPRIQTSREEEIVMVAMREFAQLQTMRNGHAAEWEEAAALVMPTARNTFFYGNYNWPGMKKTDKQVDATGMMALNKFGAICDSLLTPRNMKWHILRASDPYVMKDRATKLWFEQVGNILFQYRYDPNANFSSQNQQNYQSLGAFGTGCMFIDAFDSANYGPLRGLRYRACPLGEIFMRQNHQGLVDGVIRWMKLTAYQAYEKWGPDKTNTFPEVLRPALMQSSEMQFNFLHRICPRVDYEPGRLDAQGKPFTSQYISLEGKSVVQEGGYRSFPFAASRYIQAPGEVYGRGPASTVLPALKTLNAEKTTFLKQGHRAADPVLLTYDDGLMSMDLRPGAMNPGGMSPDGKPLVGVLPTGNIQTTIEMMQEERALINDAFLVSLFQILTETPTMTATEVIERTNEKGILLAPTVGRQQSEYLGPMIDREIDVLAAQGLLPPMPPRLREAAGAYETIYTSPLSRAMRAQEAAGFMRVVENLTAIVQVTQDMSPFDNIDFDTAVPEIAEIQGVPFSWMASDGQRDAKRKARAQNQAAAQQIQAMPAQAAMMKAQAVAAKTGGQPQQGQPQQPGARQGA